MLAAHFEVSTFVPPLSTKVLPLELADVPAVLALDQANDPCLSDLEDIPSAELVLLDMAGKFWTRPEIIHCLERPENDNWDIRVAKRGQRIIGAVFACIRSAGSLYVAPKKSNAVQVSWIGVHPDFRCCGVARMLLNAVMKDCAWSTPPGKADLKFYAHVDDRDVASLTLFGNAGFRALAQFSLDNGRFYLLYASVNIN